MGALESSTTHTTYTRGDPLGVHYLPFLNWTPSMRGRKMVLTRMEEEGTLVKGSNASGQGKSALGSGGDGETIPKPLKEALDKTSKEANTANRKGEHDL